MTMNTSKFRQISRRKALSLAISGAGLFAMKSVTAQEATANKPLMSGGIRHIVFVCFPDDCPAATIQSIFDQLAQIKATLPGMTNFHAGPNIVPGQQKPRFTHGFTIDFADQATRDAYWVHPGHLSVGKRLIPLLKGGREDVQIVQIPL